jgi:hypothetical protein
VELRFCVRRGDVKLRETGNTRREHAVLIGPLFNAIQDTVIFSTIKFY